MKHTEDAVDGVAVLLSPHTSIDTSPHMYCHTRHIVQRERYRDGYISTHSHNIHPLIVTNPPTFAYKSLAKCGAAYILGLCVRVIDSLASVTQTHQPVGHTHIHTNRHQPI